MKEAKRKISRKSHEFDIISLLRLLKSLGYNPDEIRYKGHNSICSQSGLIQGVIFSDHPVREVVITLNLGLLSAQTPLPSYFRKMMEADITGGRRFEDFVAYFDHHLIRDYVCNIYPEINRFYFPSWELSKRRYLEMLDLRSINTLHWLFQMVFPEIGVKVEKVPLGRGMQTDTIRLGRNRLGGNAVFGGKALAPISGPRVTLVSEEDLTDTQIPWPREIKDRLNRLIFPLLRPIGIDMEINLVLKSQTRWARLHLETYLGYDRIRNGADSYRQIRIFRGHIDVSSTIDEEDQGEEPEAKKLALG